MLHLAQKGALLLSPGHPAMLVGALRCAEPGLLQWFVAFGDRPGDAHTFRFHYAIVHADRIQFRHTDGKEVWLAAINGAHVEDPDDYRIAWQLWQQVAPLRRAFIDECFEAGMT